MIRFILFTLCSLTVLTEGDSKSQNDSRSTEEILAEIEMYEEELESNLKKLSDKSYKIRQEGKKFFMEMPAVQVDRMVQAYRKEKNVEARENLKEIFVAGNEKPAFKDWKEEVLTALTEKLISDKASTVQILKVSLKNDSYKVDRIIESEFKKRAENEDLLAVYNNTADKGRSCLFPAVADKLKEQEIKAALTSKVELLKLKAAHYNLTKGDIKALNVLCELLKTGGRVSDRAGQLLRAATGQNFFFHPGEEENERKESITKWKKWLAETKNIKIKLPLKIEVETFVSFCKDIKLYSAGYLAGNSCALTYKGKYIFDNKNLGVRGLNVFAVKNGRILLREGFDTWESKEESARFADALKKLPKGAFVAIIARDEASTNLTDEAVEAINTIGGEGTLKGRYRAAYYCVGQKGMNKGKAIESDNKSEGPIFYPESAKGKIKFFKNQLHPSDQGFLRELEIQLN